MSSMRDILLNFPIVWNGEQYVKLTEIYLPLTESYEKEDDKKKAYNFISILYENKVPTLRQSKIFEKNLWKNDSRIKCIDIEDCVKKVESLENINTKVDKIWKFMDDFLMFIKRINGEYLEKYAIIPNMYSEFVKLTKELATSTDVPENMIECLIRLEKKPYT